jgi:hypothetical protein
MKISDQLKILFVASAILVLLAGCKKAEPTPSADTVLTSVALTVDASLSATPEASATATATTTPTETATPTASPTAEATQAAPTQENTAPPAGNCDAATFAEDVSIPDGTQLAPDTDFIKTWKILNSGSCTWNKDYAVVFVDGSDMNGDSPTYLTVDAVSPGSVVDISVEMTAPDSTGKFTGYWRMQNAEGVAFGDTFYVEIEVVKAGETKTPTPTTDTTTLTPTATEALLTATPTATATAE